MKRCLVDVNVWLALLAANHDHHVVARNWFDQLGPGEATLCRPVQLALIRLLGNPTIMGHHALPTRAAWDLIAGELLLDERVEFAYEPPSLNTVFPGLLRYPIPTGKLVNDAYLAAFAIASGRRLATLDSGFRQFAELNTELLRAN
jgi:toxin-antitoxin system PIN domain toxin